jgi:tripartite-type tricarboxylate transporter receptor subunit TctC
MKRREIVLCALSAFAQALYAAITSEDLKSKLIKSGFEPIVDTPDEAQRFVAAERARIVPLAQSLGFRLN